MSSLEARAAQRRGLYAKSLAPARPARNETLHRYARSIASQPEPQCPNTAGWWVISESSGLAIPRNCKRWSCAVCRRTKRRAVLAALQHGVSVADAQSRRVRHLVLTDRDGALDFASFYRAFTKRLVPRFRRAGYLAEYACALEAQPNSGRLHAHVLLVEPGGRSGFIPKATLDAMTSDCGFGWSYITLVRDIPQVGARLADYFVKGPGRPGDAVPSQAVGKVPSYIAKAHEVAQLSDLAASRLRPFRVSRNWPMSLKAAADQLREEMYGAAVDPGPWVAVSEARCSEFLDPLREMQRRADQRATAWQEAREMLRLMS